MAQLFEPDAGYTHLRALSETAFSAGHVEVAYYLLMAAMHCAEDTHDASRLREVAQVTRTMLRTLDTKNPSHRLATTASLARGAPNLFEEAAKTAELTIPRVEAERRETSLRVV
jgi:hypothetical protein